MATNPNPLHLSMSYFMSRAPAGRKVCIAKWSPRYWQGPLAPLLAPSDPHAQEWRQAYRQDLAERFASGASLGTYLMEVARMTPHPILCCYERVPEECHRSELAAVIRELLGWEVPEWRPAQQGWLL